MKAWFRFKSLRTAFVLTYLFLIASSFGLLAWRIGGSLDASRFAETKRDQEGRAILAASAAEDWLANYRDQKLTEVMLQEETQTLAHEISQPIVILDPQGRVLIDSEHPHEVGADDSQEPEIIAMQSGRVGSAIRYDPDDSDDVLFTVAPVYNQRELVGLIRLELPMRLVRDASQELWLRIIGATLLAACVTAVVSLLFARVLTNPIAQISRAATALANGDLDQRIQVTGPEEIEQLADSFNYMAGRISRVMRDQRAFVANAAHELRTPLTTIRLRAEALHQGAKDDPAVAPQFLADIVSETDRLARLVDELLDLSRLETGMAKPRRELVSLETIVREVAQELTPNAAAAGVSLAVNAPAAVAHVRADPDQIRQVFINLLVNAIKFTPAGGSITVQFSQANPAHEAIPLPPGNWLVATIRDTGSGIPPEDLPHIFERFYRGEKTRSERGAGLGLAIVKSIIEAHRGKIWATSPKDQGATIVFALPLD